ncbi:HigA family addiction module antitoxin [Oxalobacter aliiformigenes]|jgi:addiction module HigA family antidote|uniref:HigA family addiction module antitoxin n=1 Tax=Oxalobacter aliiformigenes TaxID=2946593 RepID=UPI0022AEC2D1|nr:HigA family addiction module antitoxin [Oxalobacter aliiformigenes]MCZ4065507.1 HigA family addiction module antitoxin [Oxalobacter aliiformigenes]WAV99573.1 HigA family addiction module antitoxin [Oxalobacter aliiformigenes]
MDRLPNIHPGEVLLEEFLIPLGISKYRLAKTIRVPAMRISEICAGKRSITPDTAIRLGKAFGTSSAFWLGLQADYDTEEILLKNQEEIDQIQILIPHITPQNHNPVICP